MRAAPWSHENEDRHRARDRVRRLGIDVSRDRRRRPDAAAAAHARGALRRSPARCSTAGRCGAATSPPREARAGASGRRPRSSAGCSSSSTRAASRGPSSASPPGLTALLVAAVPLFTALLDRTVFGVRLSLGALAGIATGLLGVALLVGPSAHVDPVGAAVILAAAFAWAAGSAYGRVAPLPRAPFLSAAMQMLCAAALLAVAGAATGEVGQRASGGDLGGLGRRRSASSSSSARSWPSPPTAGCCGAARRACSSRPTPTSTRRSPSCSAGRFAGEAVGGRELAAGAVVVASVGMLVLARHAPHAHEEAEPLPETVGPTSGQGGAARSARVGPAARRLRRMAP